MNHNRFTISTEIRLSVILQIFSPTRVFHDIRYMLLEVFGSHPREVTRMLGICMSLRNIWSIINPPVTVAVVDEDGCCARFYIVGGGWRW
jgi:hypothetical protein